MLYQKLKQPVKVAQCDRKTGKIIGTFSSMNEASRETGVSQASVSQAVRTRGTGGVYYFIIIISSFPASLAQ